MTTTIKLILDRVEEGTAVLLSMEGGDEQYEISAETLASLSGEPAEANRCYLCDVEDSVVLSARRVENPDAGENKKRLTALFQKRSDRPNH